MSTDTDPVLRTETALSDRDTDNEYSGNDKGAPAATGFLSFAGRTWNY